MQHPHVQEATIQVASCFFFLSHYSNDLSAFGALLPNGFHVWKQVEIIILYQIHYMRSLQ